VEILPGGGIRAENVRSFLDQTACTQLHSSMKSLVSNSDAIQRRGIQFRDSEPGDADAWFETQSDRVEALVRGAAR